MTQYITFVIAISTSSSHICIEPVSQMLVFLGIFVIYYILTREPDVNDMTMVQSRFVTDGDPDLPECAVGRHCCRQPDGTSGDMAVQARSQQSHELLYSTHGHSR